MAVHRSPEIDDNPRVGIGGFRVVAMSYPMRPGPVLSVSAPDSGDVERDSIGASGGQQADLAGRLPRRW